MVTTKKKVVKKTAVKVPTVKKTPLSNDKLHVVLGFPLMKSYVEKCAEVSVSGMSKSEVGRLLVEAFVEGNVKIIPPKVTQKKAIRA